MARGPMGPMPGGPGGMDIGKMMKQVQEMQAEMAKAQEELANEEVEASSGGGMVKVKIKGDLTVTSIEIDPDAVDPDDAEMLADLVLAAVNEAIRAAQERASAKLGGITGGLGGMWPAGHLGVSDYAAPIERLIAELCEAAGDRPAHRPAARVPHPACARRRVAGPRRRRSAR